MPVLTAKAQRFAAADFPPEFSLTLISAGKQDFTSLTTRPIETERKQGYKCQTV
jgi:hypothetical protein